MILKRYRVYRKGVNNITTAEDGGRIIPTFVSAITNCPERNQ